MEGVWLWSYLVLWVVVLFQILVLFALMRQVGLLHMRLGPAGARTMNPGPRLGDLAPPFEATDVLGRSVTLGIPHERRTLLIFISTGCAICREILPALRTLERTEKGNLDIVLISPRDDLEAGLKFLKENRLTPIPLVTSDELAARYQVGLTPYAILVDREGRVRAKGLVNNLAHLESLLTAEEMGYHSIQSFLRKSDQRSEKPGGLLMVK